MGWEGYVACMWVKWNACRVLLGKSEGERPQEGRGMCWRMILKWILDRIG
jgi:hypothetical protein